MKLLRHLLISVALLLGSALPGLAAHQMGNGVCETTATTGTGTVNLGGTYAPYSTFVSQITSGSTVTYRITTGSGASLKVETGTGTFTDGAPDTLSRDAEWTTDDQTAPITELTLSGTSTVCIGTAASTFNGDKGDITFGAGFTTATVDADSVALGTDTTGNYAAGDAEAGAALTGDSATGFFSAGTIEDARIDGSAEADEVNPTLGTQTQGNYALGDAEGGAATTGDSATAFFSTGTIEDARIDGSAEADEVNPTLGSQTQGNYMSDVTAGTGVATTHTPAEGSNATIAFSYTDKGTDPALGADECYFSSDATTAGNIVCEGDTANTAESRMDFGDPSADRVFTLPDANSYPITDKDYGDITTSASGQTWSVDADSIALGTDTTGNYAAGDAEGGAALTGDSATSFFSTGTIEDARIDGSAEADEVNPTLGTQTQGNYVADVADGTGIDGTAAAEGATYTPTFDATELSTLTWGSAGTSFGWTFNSGTTDPAVSFGDGTVTWTGTSWFTLDDRGQIHFNEQDANGSNYLAFNAPATVTTNQLCTLEDDASFIPDSCVGDGSDASGMSDGDKGDITVGSSGTTLTIDADSVALTTDTTGNYAAGDGEAGAALTGDSATSFFSTGTIEDARIDGSAESDEVKPTEAFIIGASDEFTPLTAGTAKTTFRMPYAFTLTGVRCSLTTAATTGTFTVDINEAGTTLMSTNKLRFDATEETTTTYSGTAAGITDSSLADDAEITIDIDDVGSGTGAGLKCSLIGTRT